MFFFNLFFCLAKKNYFNVFQINCRFSKKKSSNYFDDRIRSDCYLQSIHVRVKFETDKNRHCGQSVKSNSTVEKRNESRILSSRALQEKLTRRRNQQTTKKKINVYFFLLLFSYELVLGCSKTDDEEIPLKGVKCWRRKRRAPQHTTQQQDEEFKYTANESRRATTTNNRKHQW